MVQFWLENLCHDMDETVLKVLFVQSNKRVFWAQAIIQINNLH